MTIRSYLEIAVDFFCYVSRKDKNEKAIKLKYIKVMRRGNK